MRKSDVAWVENLARHACGRARRSSDGTQAILSAVQGFSEELCGILSEYCTCFNEIVREQHPEALIRIFRLANNRSGLMLMRGRDKLVISTEPPMVRVRVVQVFAYGERCLEELEFEAQMDVAGDVAWLSIIDGQRVNPELVARYYLSPFLASGCSAYIRPNLDSSKDSAGFSRTSQ